MITVVVLIVIIAVPVIMIISFQAKVTLDEILKVNTLENMLKEKGSFSMSYIYQSETTWYYELSGNYINLYVDTNIVEEDTLIYKNTAFILNNDKAYYYYYPNTTNENIFETESLYRMAIYNLEKMVFLDSRREKDKYIIEAEYPNEINCVITVDKNYFIESVKYYSMNDPTVQYNSVKIDYNIKKEQPKTAEEYFESDEKVKVSIIGLFGESFPNKEFKITKGQMFAMQSKFNSYLLCTDPEGKILYNDGYCSAEPVTEDLQLYLIEKR